ncbi:hypothetical protein ACFP1Z_05605 [Streptomyces gamaensis]|uniref:Uncharacterized protein n=1 Tax=Streptomyces gamaensis TaxID=1763542 RepID=A0ABW0YSW7_9ACTN
MSFSGTDAATFKGALAAASQQPVWHSATFATLDDAVNFVNTPPAQGAGEVGFSDRPDGQVDLIFFL